MRRLPHGLERAVMRAERVMKKTVKMMKHGREGGDDGGYGDEGRDGDEAWQSEW